MRKQSSTAHLLNMEQNSDKEPQEIVRSKSRLPKDLQKRLLADSIGDSHYKKVSGVDQLNAKSANSTYSEACRYSCFYLTCLIESGKLGLLQEGAQFFFLAQGYHLYSHFGRSLIGEVNANILDKAIINGTAGFITLSEGNIGIMQYGAEYKLLPAGTYEWNSPRIKKVEVVDITKDVVKLGPYTLLTVPKGNAAITYDNGTLVILGENKLADTDCEPTRTFFLDHERWKFSGYLSLRSHVEELKDNRSMSKDNVELYIDSQAEWCIADPSLAVEKCGENMEEIRANVNSQIRAVISTIIRQTNISEGVISSNISHPVHTGVVVDANNSPQPDRQNEQPTNTEQSEIAVKCTAALRAALRVKGIEILDVSVSGLRMKNDDIRIKIAALAAIPIDAKSRESAADADKYAVIKKAEADAESKMLDAKAEAARIRMMTDAEVDNLHKLANARLAVLGDSDSTAAKIATIEAIGSAYARAKNVTLFGPGAANLPSIMLSESAPQLHERTNTGASHVF